MTHLPGSPIENEQLSVAMVDDTSLYSKRLMESFGQIGTRCILYGPLSTIPSKSPTIMERPVPQGSRVWSQNLFPFQVLRRALRDKPDVVHVQFEFYGIHSFGPIYSSIGLPILLLLLRLARLRTVVTLHSVLPSNVAQLARVRDTSPNARGFPILILRSFLMLSYKLVGLLANGILVHARVFKKRLVRQYRVSPSKIMVLPHGVDLWNTSAPTTEHDGGHPSSLILYFGVLSPRKGLENLLQAFAIVARKKEDCELLLAGSSPPYYRGYESRLKELTTRLGLGKRIHFLGAVDNAAAHNLFAKAKFVILPYSYNVSASGVLSWAIGHAVPVIVSDNEYFREELSQREFGIRVAPGEPRLLAEAIERLLTRQDLCESLSRGAREAGQTRSWSAVASRTVEYYRDVISNNGHARRDDYVFVRNHREAPIVVIGNPE